jgi:hypothetical protein
VFFDVLVVVDVTVSIADGRTPGVNVIKLFFFVTNGGA